MRKKENFLDYIPRRNPEFGWQERDGIVTVEMKHIGFFDHIAQRFFHRPKISYIKLDKYGSFVWIQIDGSRSVSDIGELMKAEFADEAEPIYQRLVRYMRILKDNRFVDFTRPLKA